MNMKSLVAVISALCGFSSFALNDAGLTHRWSFNGDLTDSFGGSALLPVDAFVAVENNSSTWFADGDAFSTDGEVFNFKGGQVRAEFSWETTGVNGPEICSSDCTELTIELWAAQHSWQAYSSIFSGDILHEGEDTAVGRGAAPGGRAVRLVM